MANNIRLHKNLTDNDKDNILDYLFGISESRDNKINCIILADCQEIPACIIRVNQNGTLSLLIEIKTIGSFSTINLSNNFSYFYKRLVELVNDPSPILDIAVYDKGI